MYLAVRRINKRRAAQYFEMILFVCNVWDYKKEVKSMKLPVLM